ncbi:MAG: phosphoribosylanthranilate isomerase [Pseudomonadota bacterium]|nr:phosphoribosylanthranilate isomerase [Pseudomonadota bacterium]
MKVATKICGVSDRACMDAAADGGAAYVGFVFFPPSPRNVTLSQAAALVPNLPDEVEAVALVVDPDNSLLDAIVGIPGISMLQLHGVETPSRVLEIKDRTGRPTMKAVKVSEASDLDAATAYFDVADMLLFDAKPPPDLTDALPGGNAISFDWNILTGREWPMPWMRSGGLAAGNVIEAIQISGAPAVDVSSGVERTSGLKDPDLIRSFLSIVKSAL